MLRVGTVPYLVARPLTWGLADAAGVELCEAPPAELARGLREGRLDVALASSILAVEGDPPLALWQDGPVIASRGPVRSVLLFLRPGACGAHAVDRVLLDPHSRTGQGLARIVLADHFGATCAFDEAEPGVDPFTVGADAIQLIGDPALEARIDHPDWAVVDLGETWWQLTRLPFVYAGWIGRPGFDPAEAADALRPAAENGLRSREALVREGAHLGHDASFLRRYLHEDLHYQLPREEVAAALAEFSRRLRRQHPEESRIVSWTGAGRLSGEA